MEEKDVTYGGSGGNNFADQAIETVSFTWAQVGGNGGHRLTSININGDQFGHSRGRTTSTLRMRRGEYINHVDIETHGHGWPVVDKLKLRTNLGQEIRGGGSNQDARRHVLNNVRVVRVGGRTGAAVDQLRFNYIQDYVPSEELTQRVPAVIFMSAPTFEDRRFISSASRRLRTFERVLETSVSQQVSVKANIAAEFLEKTLKIGLGIEAQRAISSSRSTSLSDTIEVILRDERSTEFINGETYTFITTDVDVFMDPDGDAFVIPREPETYEAFTEEEYSRLGGYLNLVGTALETRTQLQSRSDPAMGGLEVLRT